MNLRGIILNHPTLLPASPGRRGPPPPPQALCRHVDIRQYSSRGDALPQPRYVHDGVQQPTTRRGGVRTEPGMVVAARASAVHRSASQRSTASGFSCSRGVIVLGERRWARHRVWVHTCSISPASSPASEILSRRRGCHQPHARPHSPPRGREGTRTQTCRFGNAIAEGCWGVSSHAEPARFRDAGSFVCVCVWTLQLTAAMRHRQPDGDSRHVPCLLDSVVGFRWFERRRVEGGRAGWVDTA